MTKPLSATLLAAVLLAAAHGASAQYPVKPIRIVLPYPPGGGGDVVLRTLQPGVEKRLGQNLIVDYRPGAAGNIGMGEVAKAEPDGYTLVVGPTNNFVINQYLFKSMGFDPLSAFVPVSMLVENPYLVTVSSGVPGNSFAEFAAYAKANPGKLNFGSPGNATVPHLSGLMLSDYLNAGMVHVPYKGSQPGLQALMTNEVQMFIASYGIVIGALKTGKAKALAVSGNERLKPLPDVPTASEVGIPDGVLYSNWWALAGPRGMDGAIVSRLAEEFRAAAADPAIQAKFVDQGAIVITNSPAQARERMGAEARVWKSVVEKAGLKPAD
ncbi:MAG TPA: tripartite tricarboxylate transporter substrate binding protein [Burkholderiales bacterium]|nr:tripartite tricarboxylate transporter substrate binding protein [Burkholderiales bacterium]